MPALIPPPFLPWVPGPVPHPVDVVATCLASPDPRAACDRARRWALLSCLRSRDRVERIMWSQVDAACQGARMTLALLGLGGDDA